MPTRGANIIDHAFSVHDRQTRTARVFVRDIYVSDHRVLALLPPDNWTAIDKFYKHDERLRFNSRLYLQDFADFIKSETTDFDTAKEECKSFNYLPVQIFKWVFAPVEAMHLPIGFVDFSNEKFKTVDWNQIHDRIVTGKFGLFGVVGFGSLPNVMDEVPVGYYAWYTKLILYDSLSGFNSLFLYSTPI